MPEQVKKRRYDASRRQAAAALTRSSILSNARELFISRGYAATTMADIAAHAGVAADTLYAVVGTKPVLFRELIETALSGTDQVVAGQDRDYAQRMRASEDIHDKLAIYAHAVTLIQQRLAPLFLVLREAASANPELGQLWQEISRRRAHNMRALTDDLTTTGAVRTDLTRDEIADIIWTMNSSEYYAQLVLERGWTPRRFTEWLGDAWERLLLTRP
jgi:AcrR family transcriptional regulator